MPNDEPTSGPEQIPSVLQGQDRGSAKVRGSGARHYVSGLGCG